MADGSPKTALSPHLQPGFAGLYREHAGMVRRALRQLGVAPASLDDAVQDVFVVLHRRLDDYDQQRSLANWLWGIARGVASGYRRGEHRRHRLQAALPVPEAGGRPERGVARRQATAILDDFLGSLDPDKCAVFVLSEIEGRRGPEIASLLDVNLNTVYARLRAARQRFDAAVARHRTQQARPLFAGWLSVSWPAWLGKPAVALSVGALAALVMVPPSVPQAEVAATPTEVATAPGQAVADPSSPASTGPRAHRRMLAVQPPPAPPPEEEDELLVVEDAPPVPRARAARVAAPASAVQAPAADPEPEIVEAPLGPPPRAPWLSRVQGEVVVHHPDLLTLRQDFIDELLRITLHL